MKRYIYNVIICELLRHMTVHDLKTGKNVLFKPVCAELLTPCLAKTFSASRLDLSAAACSSIVVNNSCLWALLARAESDNWRDSTYVLDL